MMIDDRYFEIVVSKCKKRIDNGIEQQFCKNYRECLAIAVGVVQGLGHNVLPLEILDYIDEKYREGKIRY